MKINTVNLPAPQMDTQSQAAANAAANSAMGKDQTTSADTQQNNLVKAIDSLNKDAEVTNRQVRFALNQDTNRIIIEVVDKDTNQVVSTFPPKQILEMAASLKTEIKPDVVSEVKSK